MKFVSRKPKEKEYNFPEELIRSISQAHARSYYPPITIERINKAMEVLSKEIKRW